MPGSDYALLEGIESPSDLRALPEPQLAELAAQLRTFLIDAVSGSGGHLASGLGAVELTIALHYLFNTPFDRLIWDVGHQAYPHKVLTGRRKHLHSIRKQHGLKPFCSRAESEYDPFGAGHSSTSISAAVGMAVAARHRGIDRKTIAVIGDGSMTAGLAFEAMNHAGAIQDLDVLVIVNDNRMSISGNVGALQGHLNRRADSRHAPEVAEPSDAIFAELGFACHGPVDGHDLDALLPALRRVQAGSGPRLLHVVTCKGKGYSPAEDDPIKYHGVGRFCPKQGIQPPAAPPRPAYSRVFGDWLCDMAAVDERLVGITPAMREGSGMVQFAQRYPQRYFDVGIAEQHAVTFAGGLAAEGLKPVVAIYSSFLQRAYDQVVHDIVLQRLPVLFAIDRAGLAGQDGPTHAGAYDVSFLRALPDVVIMTPADENECRQMLCTGFQLDQPAAVRYPRGAGPGVEVDQALAGVAYGKAQVCRSGKSIAILAFGTMLAPALDVAAALDATVVNMRFVRPLDTECLAAIAADHDYIVTVEENVVAGGAGAAVAEYFSAAKISVPVFHIGLPERFVEHGEREEMLADAGLDARGIQAAILDYLQVDEMPRSATSLAFS